MFCRRVIERDLPELVEMARRFWSESPVHRDFRFDPGKVADLITMTSDHPDWLAIVAADERGICGMALVYAATMFFGPDVEVCDLAFYVDPARRGGRAAVLMLADIEAFARLHRAGKVSIGIHTGINHAQAVRFFTKLGFELDGQLVSKRLV
jgi:GNAT superfamily N-acetyltransferase